MNKRAITIIVIFLVVLVAGICEQVYLVKTFQDIANRLNSVAGATEKFEKSTGADMEQVIELRDYLRKKHPVLGVFVPHRELNEIEYVYGEMLGALVSEDFDTANQQLFKLRAMVHEINDMFAIRIWNVL